VQLSVSPFVDPDNGDFTLVSGCEAIGAGTPANLDIGATQRPGGRRPRGVRY